MRLGPRELDKLLLHNVGSLAQKRLARGVQLNIPEATALIASVLCELIRDGRHSVADLMDLGKRIIGRRHVLPEVAATMHEVQVEATFPDGSKLVTVHSPISTEEGDLSLALYGSFLPIPSQNLFPDPDPEPKPEDAPGALKVLPGMIELVPERKRYEVKVSNVGDRPIQIGSHYHFIETNASLSFDRELSYGRRLDIAAGTAVRFEPGDTKTVTLVDIGGKRIIQGGNNLASGPVDPARIPEILNRIKELGFCHVKQPGPLIPAMPHAVDRHVYADMFGPTTADRVRLGDTSLWLKVEKDYTVYGDECKFGGGKVLREGMGQATGIADAQCLDLIITNCLIVDYTSIYKADIGITGGMIVGIGKGGNPDVMDGVTPGMIVGVTTEVLAGEGQIVTAGAIDAHIHYICPQICDEAITSGITTLIGGGTGPNTGTKATTCTPGDFHIKMMLQSTDTIPLNFGFTGKGNTADKLGLDSQIRAGAIGLKLHEDWGTTNAAIDTCLELCDEMDVQATIHTDTLNESGYVESSIQAYKNRTIHAYHCEGAGGGHSPDIIRVVGEKCVLPSSTNPTRPYTKNTLDEHIDMLMVCHHLDRSIPEDIAFAESRIRGETIAAEDVLHDLGAISIISSDSQAMGRVGEVISRTWHTAHKMKLVRGHLKDPSPGDTQDKQKRIKFDDGAGEKDDNFRIRRYIAKYTINPAIAHGVSHIIGSIEVGKLADLVLWQPCYFGTKPETILKGGVIAYAQMGDANASIPTTQPVICRPMFGALPNGAAYSVSFVSQASAERVKREYGLKKRVEAVKNCRGITKEDMKLNSYLPNMVVDPETYEVQADGFVCECPPSEKLPLTQATYLF